MAAGLRLEIVSPWSCGKEFHPQSLMYGFLTPCSELTCVTGSFPPSTQDAEHTLSAVFSWSEICSDHWNSTGNWRQRCRKRLFVNNWLSATAAKRLGVIPNRKILLLFINVLTPSPTALSLPRSDDSLNFWHFSFLKEMNPSLHGSKFALEWGMKTYLPLIFWNLLSSFLEAKPNIAMPLAVLALAQHFPGNYGCSWTFEAFGIHFSFSLYCLYFLIASFFRGEMNTNLPHRWTNSGSCPSPALN